jgi:hypothetical protein
MHNFRQQLYAKLIGGRSANSVDNHVIPLKPIFLNAPKKADTDLLRLVFQAAEAIRSREQQIVDSEAQIKALVQRAADELRVAKKHIESVGDAQHAAETQAIKYAAKVKELEKLLKQRESIIADNGARVLVA